MFLSFTVASRIQGTPRKMMLSRRVTRHVLKSLLERAVEWGYLKSNPAKGVKKFRVDVKELKLSGNPGDRSGVRPREEDVAEFVRNRTIKAQWRKFLLNVGMLVAVPNLGLNVIATCMPQDYLL